MDDDIDLVDDLPRPARSGLAFDAVIAVCRAAVVAAARERGPERRRDAFVGTVRGMEPSSPATVTVDGWARLGAVQGAIDAWTETTVPVGPKDAPNDDCVCAYSAAYTLAAMTTRNASELVKRVRELRPVARRWADNPASLTAWERRGLLELANVLVRGRTSHQAMLCAVSDALHLHEADAEALCALVVEGWDDYEAPC